MNRFLAFAVLCGLSLTACAQQAAPPAEGQKAIQRRPRTGGARH